MECFEECATYCCLHTTANILVPSTCIIMFMMFMLLCHSIRSPPRWHQIAKWFPDAVEDFCRFMSSRGSFHGI